MNLEVASYIAGIVAAVAGVWSLYYARAQLKIQQKPKKEQPAQPDRPPVEEKPATEERLLVNTTDVPADLVLAFKTIDTMFNKPKRDEALKAIIGKALQGGHVEFAIGIASRVWHKPTKDATLGVIIDAALSAKQVELAHLASEHYEPHRVSRRPVGLSQTVAI